MRPPTGGEAAPACRRRVHVAGPPSWGFTVVGLCAHPLGEEVVFLPTDDEVVPARRRRGCTCPRGEVACASAARPHPCPRQDRTPILPREAACQAGGEAAPSWGGTRRKPGRHGR
jgi:hypothetical protein